MAVLELSSLPSSDSVHHCVRLSSAWCKSIPAITCARCRQSRCDLGSLLCSVLDAGAIGSSWDCFASHVALLAIGVILGSCCAFFSFRGRYGPSWLLALLHCAVGSSWKLFGSFAICAEHSLRRAWFKLCVYMRTISAHKWGV